MGGVKLLFRLIWNFSSFFVYSRDLEYGIRHDSGVIMTIRSSRLSLFVSFTQSLQVFDTGNDRSHLALQDTPIGMENGVFVLHKVGRSGSKFRE
jgi:hypothetical protein